MQLIKKYFLSPFIPVVLALLLFSCKTSQISVNNAPFSFQILQLNDVYEIAPLEGGKVAGLARVATVRDELISENPQTLTIMAGDFLSPSLIGTLKDGAVGERIQGLQMVETMNALGIDYVTFGNHEFDISEEALQARINASDFEWVSSNVSQKKGEEIAPFQKNKEGQTKAIPTYFIHQFKNATGQTLRLGIIGVTLPFNKAPYVYYEDEFEKAREVYEQIKDKTDVVIIISHLEIAGDKILAEKMPEIPLIMGGHDHTNMKVEVTNNYITKADANAKTVYIHRFKYDFKTKTITINSKLKEINDQIVSQAKTEAVVEKWQNKANESMIALGYTPDAVVVNLKESLDGRESTIRYEPTLLGKIIAKSMLEACPTAQVALLNSGSVRIDDQLIGQITQTDILRILPFGGGVVLSEWKGKDLLRVLDIGLYTNRGLGGYLQHAGIKQAKDKRWFIGEEVINPKATYQVVLPSFLAAGREANLDFLKDYTAEEVDTKKTIGIVNDVRNLLIHYLENNPLDDN